MWWFLNAKTTSEPNADAVSVIQCVSESWQQSFNTCYN